jgi:hypothetical protein
MTQTSFLFVSELYKNAGIRHGVVVEQIIGQNKTDKVSNIKNVISVA